eukprot:TRINITY_DN33704_c0_g1_i1.p1 TRINITY_DN33704_c0_g1~~TRINITY_DN33704_c0_g1_i1.p1  ORF type:complete len:604 (-),score=74.05 TRINITY_DN33704_c0_g1_i1:153-1940(-)
MSKVLASDAPAKSKSQQLKQLLKADPNNADAWNQVLHSYLRHYGPGPAAPDQLQKMLGSLKFAVVNIPAHSPNLTEIAAEVWIRYAALTRYVNAEEARTIYKRLSQLHIADGWASFYTTWAELEHSMGNTGAAEEILHKAMELAARPYSALIETSRWIKENQSGESTFAAKVEAPLKQAPRTPLRQLAANVTPDPKRKNTELKYSPKAVVKLEQRLDQPLVQAQPRAVSPEPLQKRPRLVLSTAICHPTPEAPPRAAEVVHLSGNNLTPQCPNQPTPSLGSSVSNSPRSPMEYPDRTIQINGVLYTLLCQVGRGGTSEVFKALTPQFEIVAIKRVNLRAMDPRARNSVVLEVELLKRFKGHPRIVELLDFELVPDTLIQMVLELGEIDLQALVNQHKIKCPDSNKFTWNPINENEIRHHWQQMLEAVKAIHDERVVHMDLKPANFLLVRGRLKLIDFGIADRLVVNSNGDTTDAVRAWGVGTMNYISPEALCARADAVGFNDARVKVGKPADIWSLGIILYQLVFGFTPFSSLSNLQRSIVIPDSRYPIQFPSCSNLELLNVIQLCLQRDPKLRPTLPELLQHPFLHPGRPAERT